jgi:RimJ/RimL family protein N-acetyltransferase
MIDFNHGIGLKTVSFQDVGSITYSWRNDYRVWKWCRQNDVLIFQNHVDWFDKITKDNSIRMYAIHSDSGYPVGICGLTEIDRTNQRAEFSIYIGPSYQKNGFATAALKTLLSHGFLNQNLNVIWGETFVGNHAYDMFLKVGMKHDGTRREFYYKEGQFIDCNLVSMTKAEFMGVEWRQSQI